MATPFTLKPREPVAGKLIAKTENPKNAPKEDCARSSISSGEADLQGKEAQGCAVPDVTADLVVLDWQLVTEQIVNDLINRKSFNGTETTVFEAKAYLRAALIQFAQRL